MFKTGRFYNPINFDIKPGQTFTTFGQFLENLRPLTLKDFQIEHIQKLKSNEHKWIPFSWYKWRLGMKFLASSIVNPLTSSRMKGVVLQLQSPNKNHINGTQISGNLICTFSNPLIGRVSVKDFSSTNSESASPSLSYHGPKSNFHQVASADILLKGVVKSDISLFKSLSVQPDVTRDIMMKQYWDMNNFHEDWQTKFWQNTQF